MLVMQTFKIESQIPNNQMQNVFAMYLLPIHRQVYEGNMLVYSSTHMFTLIITNGHTRVYTN